jgi:hypothetical protein
VYRKSTEVIIGRGVPHFLLKIPVFLLKIPTVDAEKGGTH